LFNPTLIHAEGIPEPSPIMYGSVTNTGSFALTSDIVEWAVSGAGSNATITSTIASVNGQSFYVARIPFETRSAWNLAFEPSPNTLPLTASPTIFTRSVTVNGV